MPKKQSQTLGTQCPRYGQPVPSTWSVDAQYMVSKCPCNGHQETSPWILFNWNSRHFSTTIPAFPDINLRMGSSWYFYETLMILLIKTSEKSHFYILLSIKRLYHYSLPKMRLWDFFSQKKLFHIIVNKGFDRTKLAISFKKLLRIKKSRDSASRSRFLSERNKRRAAYKQLQTYQAEVGFLGILMLLNVKCSLFKDIFYINMQKKEKFCVYLSPLCSPNKKGL